MTSEADWNIASDWLTRRSRRGKRIESIQVWKENIVSWKLTCSEYKTPDWRCLYRSLCEKDQYSMRHLSLNSAPKVNIELCHFSVFGGSRTLNMLQWRYHFSNKIFNTFRGLVNKLAFWNRSGCGILKDEVVDASCAFPSAFNSWTNCGI